MANDALVVIFSRNSFYKRLHYLALGALVLTLIVISILVSMLVYLYRYPTFPLYFATDSVGRLINVVPVDVPNMSTDEVIAWTIAGVEAASSFDYVNYRTQLQEAQRYFTNYGWTNYMKALTASNNLVGLTQRKWVVTAQVIEKPKIIAQGLLAGAYAWKFEMPMLVTYMSQPYDGTNNRGTANIVTVVVQRQPTLQSYRGLGIVQLISRSAVTPTATPVITNTPTS